MRLRQAILAILALGPQSGEAGRGPQAKEDNLKISQAILSTLVYHDIFDYPLTAIEIHKYLIKKASLKAVENELKNFKSITGFYTLPYRDKIVKIRKNRSKFSDKKLKRAYFYTKLLKLIPTIRFVGISGALAMQNSHKNDDIDVVIICQKGNLWTTRFFANILLLPFRRYPNSKNVADRACLNIFLDELDLSISTRNLYTAHEICQLKPIYDKKKTYSKFIECNKWVKKFLPNWRIDKSMENGKWKMENGNRETSKNYHLPPTTYKLVETFLKKFQLWYMRKKVSTERIGKHQLYFHPSNTQELILLKYQKKLKSLKIADS